jgi:hypothetical protein
VAELKPGGTGLSPVNDMPERRILHLNLVREFFDQIARGEKPEEYRDRTDYWKTRLEGREYDIIRFRNGYGPDVPEMDVEWKGVEKVVRKGQRLYAIKLGKNCEREAVG